ESSSSYRFRSPCGNSARTHVRPSDDDRFERVILRGMSPRRLGIVVAAMAAIWVSAPAAGAATITHRVQLKVTWTTSSDGTELHAAGSLTSAARRCVASRRLELLRRTGGAAKRLGAARSAADGSIADLTVKRYLDPSTGQPVAGS